MGLLPENQVTHHIEKPAMLIDELSSTEYYIGTSRRGGNTSISSWRIQKIWKIGNIWYFGYPDGNQSFDFVWTDRYNYTYIQ